MPFSTLRTRSERSPRSARHRRAFLKQLGKLTARKFVHTLRNDYRLKMRRQASHRTTGKPMLAPVTECSQLDEAAHRQWIRVRSAQLIHRFVPARKQRGEYRDHRVGSEVDRQNVEHQITTGGIEAVTAS
jgi:hypothetical protein